MRYIVIGGGISGLSIAQLLRKDNQEVIVLEAETRPGGMIKCDLINGSLFHRTGGHVFNTKRKDVWDWFWSFFDKEGDFVKSKRNSSISMNNGQIIPYPIENYVYMLDPEICKKFILDLIDLIKYAGKGANNFEEFLLGRFGKTLYELYFQPYNYKVWRRELSNVPLSWLEGKLPMPTLKEMIYNNMKHIEERDFVHSSFYYPQTGGSQFLADTLAKNIKIQYNTKVSNILKKDGKLFVNEIECDRVIFCANLKYIFSMTETDCFDILSFYDRIEKLEFHGTTSVFCEIDKNPYSWIYLPDKAYESHRIICTGNFSLNNNAMGRTTGTVEFTDFISEENICKNLELIPFSPQYLTHHYEKYTYPIQDSDTRDMIQALKIKLESEGVYLLGRFAEWEYYNMDAAMGAAMDLYNLKLNR